jgi:hypothetical protein
MRLKWSLARLDKRSVLKRSPRPAQPPRYTSEEPPTPLRKQRDGGRAGRFVDFLATAPIDEWFVYGTFQRHGYATNVKQAASRRGIPVEVCNRSVREGQRVYARRIAATRSESR